VPTGNAKEPKFIILEKFDGTWSRFCGFVQQVNIFLQLHPSRYSYDSTQVAFIGSLLLENALSWFAPFLEKHSLVLQDMVQFEALFTTAFGDSDRKRVAETDAKFAPKVTVCCNLCSRISTWVKWQSFYQPVSIWYEGQRKRSVDYYAKNWDFAGVHYSIYNIQQLTVWEAPRKTIWLGKRKSQYDLYIFNFRKKCIRPKTHADWIYI
jgi:hypothetical protein